jgi:LacI family transcriptional regulator
MKAAGIHQIAKRARVSIGTVDRALHNRAGINRATRARVLRIARDLGYVPHPAARALRTGRPNLRIGVCIPREIHFFYDQMRAGIFDEARRVRGLGVELTYRPVPALGQGEAACIRELLASKVDGLIVTPGNPSIMQPLIDEAECSGVRVVCVSTDATGSRRSSVVCVNPEISGTLAAELMTKFLPAYAKVGVVTGMSGTEDHRKKTDGFITAFRRYCPEGRISGIVEAHESERESYRKTSQLLDRNPDLNGIYVTTVNSLPVCQAVRDRHRQENVILITTDFFREMAPFIRRNLIAASVYQDPYLQGQAAVRILVDHLVNQIPMAPANYLNPGIVLRSNLHLFREYRS